MSIRKTTLKKIQPNVFVCITVTAEENIQKNGIHMNSLNKVGIVIIHKKIWVINSKGDQHLENDFFFC